MPFHGWLPICTRQQHRDCYHNDLSIVQKQTRPAPAASAVVFGCWAVLHGGSRDEPRRNRLPLSIRA